MAKWWEKQPVHFECQSGCMKCCVKPGVVYFDRSDIENAADYLKISVVEFRKEFKLTCELPGFWEMAVEEDRPCPFLVAEGCAIHEVKPKQCRTYPFWKENLATKNHWKLTAGFCPGIGEGPEIPPSDIRKNLDEYPL